MPARVETHLAFGIRQNLHTLGIKAVKARIRQNIPVGGLQVVEALDLTFALEIPRRVWKRLNTLKKVTQTGGQMLLKVETVAPDQITVFGVETGKAQPLTQAACLRSSSLI
jgi:hypothetical protein